ncbi:MAG: hypothetical protein V1735_02405 [Nanoarchaeota archaeon]
MAMLIYHGRAHAHSTVGQLDALRDRMIPALAESDYDPATPEGYRRRVKGTKRVLFAADVPEHIAEQLRSSWVGSRAVLLSHGTGFTMSNDALTNAILGTRFINATGGLGTDAYGSVSPLGEYQVQRFPAAAAK